MAWCVSVEHGQFLDAAVGEFASGGGCGQRATDTPRRSTPPGAGGCRIRREASACREAGVDIAGSLLAMTFIVCAFHRRRHRVTNTKLHVRFVLTLRKGVRCSHLSGTVLKDRPD